MPRHNIQCTTCGLYRQDEAFPSWPDKIMHVIILGDLHIVCGEFQIDYSALAPRNAAVHERERIVVWAHPVHGIRYPGRNDAKMPDAYAKAGFERKELPSFSEAQRFCKMKGLVNEALEYDRGSGRSYLDES